MVMMQFDNEMMLIAQQAPTDTARSAYVVRRGQRSLMSYRMKSIEELHLRYVPSQTFGFDERFADIRSIAPLA